MGARGSYAKSGARREEILAAALTVFSRAGYQGTSLREIAELTGLTQAGLLHHFGTREALLAEVLRKREEIGRENHPDSAGTARGLVDALRRNAAVPGLVQLHSVIAAQASDPGHPGHDFFGERYGSLRTRIAADLTARIAERRLDVDPERLAIILIAAADGLQLQWMLDPEIDMAAQLDYLLSLVGLGSLDSA